MWALPDLDRLNAQASTVASKDHIKEQLANPASVECDICSEPSVEVEPWFDIFSDDPKGVTGLCQEHYEGYGIEGESYFTCEDCQELIVKNYTWENYFVYSDGLGMQCLPCALKSHAEDSKNWLSAEDEITLDMIQAAPHLIAVGMKTPELELMGCATFDGFTGKGIYGSDGLAELRAAQYQAHGEDTILIMNGAYQFAVSIGLYTRKES